MATVESYRQFLENLLHQYTQKPSHGNIEVEVVIDREGKHYESLHVGWDGTRRIHGSVLHIDLIDGKIWIQHDGTSPGVALDLVEAGIPREDIILAFRPADIRMYTGYGTG